MISRSLSQIAAPMLPGTPRILDPISRDSIFAMLRRGEKIRAIAVYRTATGAGLAEAKRAVDEIEREHNILGTARETPNAPSGARNAGFPFSTVLLLAIAIAIGVAIYYAKVAH